MKNTTKSIILGTSLFMVGSPIFADDTVEQVTEEVQEEVEVTPQETVVEEIQEDVVEPKQEEQVKEEYTAKDLEEDLKPVDDIGVLANEVEVNSDIETNIVTKEADINNASLGNTDNVKEDDEKDNVNQIEHVENIGNEARQGTTIQVGEEHEITNGDNGNDVRLDGKKVGMTKDVTVEHIDENNKVDIDKELENLEEVSNNLGELESNTDCEQVEGTTNHYNITPFENTDEFTVIWFKANQLESNNEYHITTEENKNVIINIDDENEEDIKVTARFEFDGVKADWNDVSSKILWNFMSFGGTIDTGNIRMGTILAPNADVYVGGEPVNGSIWCNKLTGNRNEIHKVDFKVIINEEDNFNEDDENPVVPPIEDNEEEDNNENDEEVDDNEDKGDNEVEVEVPKEEMPNDEEPVVYPIEKPGDIIEEEEIPNDDEDVETEEPKEEVPDVEENENAEEVPSEEENVEVVPDVEEEVNEENEPTVEENVVEDNYKIVIDEEGNATLVTPKNKEIKVESKTDENVEEGGECLPKTGDNSMFVPIGGGLLSALGLFLNKRRK